MKRKEELSSDMSVGCLIGESSVVEGNFITKESARIDGVVKGNVCAEGKLIIGTKGKVLGNVTTEAVMVSGEVEGNIVSKTRVEITASGVVNGDITTKLLVIDEDAIFNGTCKMSKESTVVELDKKIS